MIRPHTSADDPKVLFIVMPWAGIAAGSLGVSTLKAILEREGLPADVRHLNLDFAAGVEEGFYRFVSEQGGGGDWGEILFTPHAFDLPVDEFAATTARRHFDEIADDAERALGGLPPSLSREQLLDVAEHVCRTSVGAFLDHAMESIPWDDYDVVGFSLMFSQTVPSLALARRLERRSPGKRVVFGGPSCHGVMGAEMVRSFGCVDAVCQGEADRTIVELIRSLRGEEDPAGVPGIAFRRGGQVVETGPAPLLRDLDWLPPPDYDDYLSQLVQIPHAVPRLYIETSRGCWWGQKELCSFCGVNAEGISFRRKSPERAVDEILELERRHGVQRFVASDNILDYAYFETAIPALADINRDRPSAKRLSVFYEIKSNMKKDQLRLLKAAGIDRVQPGIESFSDHILDLMRKGATACQQIQFLKWSAEQDIYCAYGVLFRNPGERAEDYRRMEEAVDHIDHLPPPRYIVPVALDRFSRYYRNPDRHGIRNIRPRERYRDLFPVEGLDLERLAYRFSYDHPDDLEADLQAARSSCLQRLRRWRDEYIPDRLRYVERDGAVSIFDRRGTRPVVAELRGWKAALFLHCDRARSRRSVERKFAEVDRDALRDHVRALVDRGWLYPAPDGRLLSLPVDAGPSAAAALAASRRRASD